MALEVGGPEPGKLEDGWALADCQGAGWAAVPIVALERGGVRLEVWPWLSLRGETTAGNCWRGEQQRRRVTRRRIDRRAVVGVAVCPLDRDDVFVINDLVTALQLSGLNFRQPALWGDAAVV
ncbi:MAG: hypothetical protein HC910_21550 [Spirulinaceae cyanobacterium SM2_1_0]|nr:hypothetical protein [Spirulinaceae cyanobacterium SM2_1_0]